MMLEGLIFVALFFISQYFAKQKKVSMVYKLRKYFLILCLLYTLMLALEIFVSYESIHEVVQQYNSLYFTEYKYDQDKVLKYFLLLRGSLHFIIIFCWVMYVVTINKYNRSMIAFHEFLNNYRNYIFHFLNK